jgi:aminopeptidase
MEPSEAAKNALECVFEAKAGESIVITCDDVKAEIGRAFEEGAKTLGLDTTLILLKTDPKVTRTEIPAEVTPYLTAKRPDIYLNLLGGNREETPFRIKLIHAQMEPPKRRLGHCPGVTLDMLTNGALALTAEEHRRMQKFAKALMKRLKPVVKIQITTPKGTDLSLSVKGRPFFTDTLIDWKTMKWMNLPTGEVIVAPIEDSLEGTLVCDVAIGGIGPVKAPVTLKVKGGKVDAATCKDKEVLRRVQNSLHTDAMAKVVGEFAFGINPKARVIEEFLETEKIRGTVHIAFGDNTDFPGGKNNSANHMDFLMDKPTVKVTAKNGAVTVMLEDGVFPEDKPEEKLPISEFYKVVDYVTIFKSADWWEASVAFEVYGKRQLGLYLWQKRGGEWKRKNKFGIRTLEEWGKLKRAVDKLSPRLGKV